MSGGRFKGQQLVKFSIRIEYNVLNLFRLRSLTRSESYSTSTNPFTLGVASKQPCQLWRKMKLMLTISISYKHFFRAARLLL